MLTFGDPVFFLRGNAPAKPDKAKPGRGKGRGRGGIGPGKGAGGGVGQDPDAPGQAQPFLGGGWNTKWGQNWGSS